MDVFRTDRIRNVVLLGHGGAGKTTLAEAMSPIRAWGSRQDYTGRSNGISGRYD